MIMDYLKFSTDSKLLKIIRRFLLGVIIVTLFYYCSEDNESNDNIPEVTIPNILVSNANGDYPPNEVTISINPKNPLNLVAGSNRKYYYYSFDGGLTWTQAELSTPLGVRGDPCVRFDTEGNTYYSHLAEVEGEILADRMVVQKSTDGGVTWNDGVGFEKNGKQHDREWMSIDHSNSQYKDNIYVTWTQYDEVWNFDPDFKSTILCTHSTDIGVTFNDAVIVSDVLGDCSEGDASLQGAKSTTGPNGEVFICWSGDNKILFDKSLDGGNTFGVDIEITDQIGGWALDNIPGVSRSDGCPSIVCDISNSQYKGHIYVLWSDLRNGDNNTDVFIKKSIDGGNTWSEVKKVNDDESGRHQFFPSMTIDPITGYLYIVFYDRRETIGNTTDVFVAKSTDGGETFKNFKVNNSTLNPVDVFLGDYIDIAAYDGMVFPIWTHADGTLRNVFVALLDDRENN